MVPRPVYLVVHYLIFHPRYKLIEDYMGRNIPHKYTSSRKGKVEDLYLRHSNQWQNLLHVMSWRMKH